MSSVLKPCKCGSSNKIVVQEACLDDVFSCLIGCVKVGCREKPVTGVGSSKEEAYSKAVSAWNAKKRKNNGLKPCPFCGGEARRYDGRVEYFGVCCSKCGAKVYGYASKSAASRAWNKRAVF
jgi:Lar family restriction alleviation protein